MTKAWPVEDLDPDKSLAYNARRILGVRMAEYFSYTGVVPMEHAVEPLHNLRISAKRLRYTLELFRSVFGELGELQIDRIKAIQRELGELHDHDVRIEMILDELHRTSTEQIASLGRQLATAPVSEHAAIAASVLRPPPDDPRRGLIALLGREHARRSERYLSFKSLWDQQMVDGVRSDLARLSTGDPELAPSGQIPTS